MHDVVEDTSHTLADLRAKGSPEAVLAIVERLSKRKGETYEQFIERVLPDRIACRVKLADLEDNMNVLRLP